MEVQTYLERINYHGSIAPTPRTLRDLQRAHLLSVPFENLSIHANEPIVLEDDALFDKIVRRRRGGFCYELNGLFAALLRALGFEVATLSARVANGEGGYTPEFDHMTLLVTLDERWLVDVGFGDSFRQPLLLDDPTVQVQNGRAYRIDSGGEHRILWQRKEGDDWKAQYRFGLQSYRFSDYLEMCHYHQTSPQSHFTKGRVCSLATPEGRLTLSDMRFITTTLDGNRHERAVQDENEYTMILNEHFGIVM